MNATEERILQALLVDDERLARKRMTELLKAHPEVKIAGEATDLSSARTFLRERTPDVVFLDIELPPASGFDLLPDLPSTTEVVFVTAHDGFAVRAFEANALDYLLKPVAPERLAASVERLLARVGTAWDSAVSSTALPRQAGRLAPTDPLLVRDGRTWRRMEPASVLAVQGEGTYTRVYSNQGDSFLILRTFSQWTEMLPESHFVRLSRSLLINVKQVERVETFSRDRSELFLAGRAEPLQLGRIASSRLRQILAAKA